VESSAEQGLCSPLCFITAVPNKSTYDLNKATGLLFLTADSYSEYSDSTPSPEVTKEIKQSLLDSSDW